MCNLYRMFCNKTTVVLEYIISRAVSHTINDAIIFHYIKIIRCRDEHSELKYTHYIDFAYISIDLAIEM